MVKCLPSIAKVISGIPYKPRLYFPSKEVNELRAVASFQRPYVKLALNKYMLLVKANRAAFLELERWRFNQGIF